MTSDDGETLVSLWLSLSWSQAMVISCLAMAAICIVAVLVEGRTK